MDLERCELGRIETTTGPWGESMVIGPEYFKPVRRRLNNQISTCQIQRLPWVVELGMRYAHPPGDKLGTPSWCSNGTAKFLAPAGAAFLGSLCVARCCHCCRTMNGNLRVAKPRREEKGIIAGVHPHHHLPQAASFCMPWSCHAAHVGECKIT